MRSIIVSISEILLICEFEIIGCRYTVYITHVFLLDQNI